MSPNIGHRTAYGLAMLSAAMWGSPPVVARAVSADVPPLTLSFLRWSVALIVLLPFVWKRLPRQADSVRESWRALVMLGLFMTAGSTLSVTSVYFTTATNAVLVNASQPALTAMVAWAIGAERLSLRQGIGIGLAFVGIVAMISRADLAVLLAFEINVGDLIMLLAVVAWACYAVQLHASKHLPDSDIVLFLIAVTGTVVLLPLAVIEAFVGASFELSAEVASAVAYLAIFPTILAIYFWSQSVRALGANRTAIFINLIPVFGVVFASVFLGERLFSYHLVGAALVFSGILLGMRRQEPRATR